jgi:hypothetical protein
MNWKNVLFLIRVERKSGRLVRGIKSTQYKENRFMANWPYWLAISIGALVGLPLGYFISFAYSNNAVSGLPPLRDASIGIFAALPTLILIFSLVFTLLQQIQRSGIKASTQVMYWLPVTWQEHTLASILASLLGFPLAVVLGIITAIISFSIFNNLFLQAILTALLLLAAAFVASATTEILRILQVRFIGAVYKSSGRAAVWVRFIGSLLFFIIFYIFYFYIFSGDFNYIQVITETQNALWFIPFLWLGITLYSLLNGLFWQSTLFVSLSVFFIAGLYYLAVSLNKLFGLYEPPAIRVQKSGIYMPKAGLLGKIGFTTVETALIRKDLRAFTRRRELMTVFIFPIVIIILPIMQSLGTTGGTLPPEISIFYMLMTFLFPAAVIAISLGNFLIGEEGRAVWRIYASPISAKSLVKAKLFFLIIFSLIILFITGLLGFVIYQPSLRVTLIALFEGIFLIFALGSISLSIGFKGADFTENPRPRMIRTKWSFIGFLSSAIAGVAILAPLIPYAILSLADSLPGSAFWFLDPLIAVIISGVIALVITLIFYRVNIGSAKDLLNKAEI